MGKKNATNAVNAPSVDQYRKQIGKQDWKKSKGALREERKKKDAMSSAMSIYDIFIMLLAFVVVIAAVYAIFFWVTMKETTVREDDSL